MNRSITASLQEYARGLIGGLLFSLPLLYTMEMWWTGSSANPVRLLAGFTVTFLLLIGYNRYAGLRRDSSWAEVAIDSVEEIGLGLVLSTIILWLLGRITLEMNYEEILGRIIVESLVVAIGVSVGTSQLGSGGDKRDSGMQESGGRQKKDTGMANHLVIAMCGSVLFAANIAPTEEILLIAVETSTKKLIGLSVLSLLTGLVILFYSDFHGADVSPGRDKSATKLVWGMVTYAIALISSAAILWFFGRFEGHHLSVCLEQILVLGFVASLGASAGRLLLQ
jgi:putative integral membrane protein (TIGR02587 family)